MNCKKNYNFQSIVFSWCLHFYLPFCNFLHSCHEWNT